MSVPEIQYSRLTTEAVRLLLLSAYTIIENPDCQYFAYRMHDNYLVEDGGRKYILRVYRNEWRDSAAIDFELAFLTSLQQHCDFVAAPVLTADETCKFEINAPEGLRYAALFFAAPGEAPLGDASPEIVQVLGQHIASIHQHSKDFVSQSGRIPQRQLLNSCYLLDRSVAVVSPWLADADRIYLADVQTALNERLSVLLKDIPDEWPFFAGCHGDVNNSNYHVHDGRLVLFDFDQCGFGWRTFDIGKYFCSLINHPDKQSLKLAFLDGYESVSPLTTEEHEAVSLFTPLASIWVMAIQVYGVHVLGLQHLSARAWEQRMKGLRRAVAEAGLTVPDIGTAV